MNYDWNKHAATVAQKRLPPSATLRKALSSNLRKTLPKTAIDLGCGNGVDSLSLLENGWNVIAVDTHLPVLEQLRQNAGAEQQEKLQTIHCSFETFPLSPCTLINASFSIPFSHPDAFPDLWTQIQNALPSGGIFSGHLFGIHDSWNTRQDMTFHTREAVLELLRDFEIIWLEETQKEGKTIGGAPKNWHVFHITAVKK